MYFDYHATIRSLIKQGKLKGYYFTPKHNKISPALVFVFDDFKRPLVPIRKHKWPEYESVLLSSINLSKGSELNV